MNKPRKGESHWKSPRASPAKNKNKTTSKNEHTDWKKAHEATRDEVVEKWKKEKRCTRSSMDNHMWRKCRKPILVAATFVYKNRGKPNQYQKPRTSTLAKHQPPPTRQNQIPKVNRVHHELPAQVWELSDTEMS